LDDDIVFNEELRKIQYGNWSNHEPNKSKTYKTSPFMLANGVVRLTFPVACKAIALSDSPFRRASLKAEQSQSHALQMLTISSFLILYVAGIIFDGHCKAHELHIHTPQFLQWQALRKTANCDWQMKHCELEENGCILGGAQAPARHIACFSVGTEKALRAFELSSTFSASSAFWLVLSVATQDCVASEEITDEGSSSLGETEVVKESISKDTGFR
jgi:hypothetical protein